MTKNDLTWRVDSNVRFRRVFDEAVVIHQEKTEALVLNEVGVSFLELCDGKRSFQNILEKLMEEYEVDPQVLEKDVREFTRELVEAQIIVSV